MPDAANFHLQPPNYTPAQRHSRFQKVLLRPRCIVQQVPASIVTGVIIA